MPKSPCVVLVPCLGPILPQCEVGLDHLASRGYEVRKVWGYSSISYGRSQMASLAIRDGFTELMWIDSDMGFNADSVDRLRASQHPFAAGVYPKKNGKDMAAVFHAAKEGDQIHFGLKGGLYELDMVGFGFVFTRVEVYQAIRNLPGMDECNGQFGDPFTPYFLPQIVNNGKGLWFLPDDYAFCWRARQAGIKIMADTTIQLSHIGPYEYTMLDVQRNGLAEAKSVSGTF